MGMFNHIATNSITIDGITFSQNASVTGDGYVKKGRNLAAAKGGATLTVRTSDTVGTLTVPTGHVATGNRLDLLYPNGGTRVQVLAGTVVPGSPNDTVPITVGTGDVLPALNTTGIIVAVAVSEPFVMVGNDIQAIGCEGSSPGMFTFTLADGTYITRMEMKEASNNTYIWHNASGIANPFVGVTTGLVFMSSFATDVPTPNNFVTSALTV